VKNSPIRPKPGLPALLSDLNTGRELLELVRAMPLPEGRPATRLLDSVKILEEICALIRSRMKGLLEENPGAVPHWENRSGASVRELHGSGSKIQAAFGDTFNNEQFIDAGQWSFSRLEKAYREAQSVDEPTAKLAVDRILSEAGLITVRQNQPSLRRL